MMLSVSAVITTFGLLLGNAVIVIGGMLVAPLLLPLLALALSVVTSSREGLIRSFHIIVRSVVIVFCLSVLVTFLFNPETLDAEILDASKPNLIYFLVAFFAGVAAAYSWVEEKMSANFPGIAVAVALLPPLCAVGVGVALSMRPIIADSLLLFLINLLGIVVASVLVFSLFGLGRLQREQNQEIKAEVDRVE